MLNFIDHEDELEFLNNQYNSNEASLVILYGRRRIGKTTLIAEFMKNKNALYFFASLHQRNPRDKTLQPLKTWWQTILEAKF